MNILYGRFNPPHLGHKRLYDTARAAGTTIALSSNTQGKNNPLSPEQKQFWFRRVVGVELCLAQTIVIALDGVLELTDPNKRVNLWAGSDQYESMLALTQKYYPRVDVKTIPRDDKSATKLREFIAARDINKVCELTGLDQQEAELLALQVRYS